MWLVCVRSVAEVRLDCSLVVRSLSVVRNVAEVHLGCSQVVESRSAVSLCPGCGRGAFGLQPGGKEPECGWPVSGV